MEKGLYKNENGTLLHAQVEVFAPDYHMEVSKYEEYTYPMHYWYYFETREEEGEGAFSALNFFGIVENIENQNLPNVY